MLPLNAKKLTLGTVVALTVLASACGGQAYREGDLGNSDVSNDNAANTSSNDDSNETLDNTLPTETYAFTLTGNGGTNTTFSVDNINTDTILKVKIIAGSAGQLSLSSGSYSNFTASYKCVRYTITALGRSVQSKVLAVDGGDSVFCPGAPTEETINFSNRLTTGHGDITIAVSAPSYDFYCQMARTSCGTNSSCLYYSGCNLSAPMRTVYKNHTVTGSIAVQTNSTEAL
jgi:hypothetical protein